MVSAKKAVLKSTFSFMRGNILVIMGARLIRWFSTRTAVQYFSLYVLSLGGTVTTIGYIEAFRSAARILLYPVGGYISDYKGRVKLVSITNFIHALTYLFFIFAQKWTLLAVGVFLQGLFLFSTPALEALMADSLPPEQRGMGFSLYQGLSSAIAILAPYTGGYLISIYGVNLAMKWLYAFIFFCGIIVVILYVRFLKETLKRPESGIPLRNFSLLLKTAYKSLWETIKWTPKGLRALVFVSALSALFTSVAGGFWIVYAVEVIKLTALEWGLITLVMGIFRAILSIPAGKLIDRYGKRNTIITALALSTLPALFFTYCKTFLQALVALIFVSIANVFLLPATSALTADIVPLERRGRIMSAFGQHMLALSVGGAPPMGFVLSLFTIFGSIAGGYIYSFNPMYPWLLLSAALFVCLTVSVIFIHEPEKPEF